MSFGLYSSFEFEPVPLQNVKIVSQFIHLTCQTCIEFTFTNTITRPIEALFSFTLESKTLVTGFTAQFDNGRTVNGVCKPKNEALNDYDDSIASGQSAVHLSKNRTSLPGQYVMSIGNLAQGQKVVIMLTYIQETLVKIKKRLEIHYSLVTLLQTNLIPYQIQIHLYMFDWEIENIQSETSHPFQTQTLSTSTLITASSSPTFISHPFLLYVIFRESSLFTPSAIYEQGAPNSNQDALMVSFIPNTKHLLSRHAQVSQFAPLQFIFLVDQSGSMWGARNQAIKNTLSLIFKSLPCDQNIGFNIFKFGSESTSLFPHSSQLYTKTSCYQVDRFIQSLTANMGGTEMMKPLTDIFKQFYPKNTSVNLFILTDGEVEDTHKVLDFVRDKISSIKASVRIFTFGIGETVSAELVQKLAVIGKGYCEFVSSHNTSDLDKLRLVVTRQLKRALQPVLQDVKILMSNELEHQINREQDHVRSNEFEGTNIFDGQRLVDYYFMKANHDLDLSKQQITVQANDLNGTCLEMKLNIQKRDDNNKALEPSDTGMVFDSSLIHKFTAWRIIDQCEKQVKTLKSSNPYHKQNSAAFLTSNLYTTAATTTLDQNSTKIDALKQRILTLSLQYGIFSSQTSFIAVSDLDLNPETTQATTESMKQCRIQDNTLQNKQHMNSSNHILDLFNPNLPTAPNYYHLPRSPIRSNINNHNNNNYHCIVDHCWSSPFGSSTTTTQGDYLFSISSNSANNPAQPRSTTSAIEFGNFENTSSRSPLFPSSVTATSSNSSIDFNALLQKAVEAEAIGLDSLQMLSNQAEQIHCIGGSSNNHFGLGNIQKGLSVLWPSGGLFDSTPAPAGSNGNKSSSPLLNDFMGFTSGSGGSATASALNPGTKSVSSPSSNCLDLFAPNPSPSSIGLGSHSSILSPSTPSNTGANLFDSTAMIPSTSISCNSSVTSVGKEKGTMEEIINQQEFEGNWRMEEKLAKLITRIGREELKKEGEANGCNDEQVWMTIVAMSFLEVKCSTWKEEWELLIEKADTWLENVMKINRDKVKQWKTIVGKKYV